MNLPPNLSYLLQNIGEDIMKPIYTHDFIQFSGLDHPFPGLSNFKCKKCKYDATYIFWQRNKSYDVILANPYSCDELIIKNIIE